MSDPDIIPINQLPSQNQTSSQNSDVVPIGSLPEAPNMVSSNWQRALQSAANKYQQGNFLQNLIAQNRVGSPSQGLATTGVGMLPMNQQEWMDIGRVVGRNILPSDITSPFMNLGLKMSGSPEVGIQYPPEMNQALNPTTQYGKNLDTSTKIGAGVNLAADIVPLITSPITAPFSKGNLPELEKGLSQKLSDIIKMGPKEMEERANNIRNNAIENFETGKYSVPNTENLTHREFSDALLNAAMDHGGTNIPGSAGETLLNYSKQFSEGGSKLLKAPEIQDWINKINDDLGYNTAAKDAMATQVNSAIENRMPTFDDVRSRYAKDIGRSEGAKLFSSSNISRASSGKMGTQELLNMKNAQSELGSPDIIGEGQNTFEKLSKTKNDLQKIISRQKNLKKIGAIAASGLGIRELWNLFHH